MLFNPQIGLPGTAEMETAKSIDLTLRKTTGAATFTLGVYHQDFDNYIYARTLDEYRENPDDPVWRRPLPGSTAKQPTTSARISRRRSSGIMSAPS
jgi:hypothetical protein